jgi:peroxiredoxin
LEDQWKEAGKAHELFCKRVMEVPLVSVNDACVNELWIKNRKEKNIRESNEALFKTTGNT